MWWFNFETQSCGEFFYGGCMGNENKYRTKEECEQTCLPRAGHADVTANTKPQTSATIARKNPVCYLPKVIGPCYGHIPRFYYNSTTEMCEEFIYGGCRGNENNFATIELCQNTCETTTPLESLGDDYPFRYPFIQMTTSSVCTLEKAVGSCSGYFLRYYYNRATLECEEFVYSGCGGNGNKFSTQRDCYETCIVEFVPLPRA